MSDSSAQILSQKQADLHSKAQLANNPNKLQVQPQSSDLPNGSIKKRKLPSQSAFFQQHPVDQLRVENYQLKNQNNILKKLDEALRKKLPSSQRCKQILLSKKEDVSNKQLQNAYKKCQIYRRQASFYRKKIDSFDQVRLSDIEARASQFARQNDELREQLKDLRRLNKLQQKGLIQIGAEGFLKMHAQNERLRDDVRRLKNNTFEGSRPAQGKQPQRSRAVSGISSIEPQATQSSLHRKGRILIPRQKVRLRTEQNSTPAEDEELINFLQQKAQRDDNKIRILLADKGKLREMLDNAKLQLAEKQKQITYLKEKVVALRKLNQEVQKTKAQTAQKSSEVLINSPKTLSTDIAKKQNQKSTSFVQYSSVKTTSKIEHDRKDTNINQVLNDKNSKYPRIFQFGRRQDGAQKWSHHLFSSKIKQVQVLPHPNGHAWNIHARYQKGEPKRYDKSQGHSKYSIFACSESSEYVTQISGGFKQGYLQYLIVTTSSKRVCKFCHSQFQDDPDCQKFCLKGSQNQHIAALHGQSDEIGVRLLGCLIQKSTR